MKEEELYKKAVELWGVDFQLDMIIEECLEMCHAILKYKRGKGRIDDIIEEGVDVYIMLRQLRHILVADYFQDTWDEVKFKKLNRLEELIEKEVSYEE